MVKHHLHVTGKQGFGQSIVPCFDLHRLPGNATCRIDLINVQLGPFQHGLSQFGQTASQRNATPLAKTGPPGR